MQVHLQEEMATAIDASCSLLDGKPAAGQCEDECRSDDETDSESEADDDASDMDATGPALVQTAHLKPGAICALAMLEEVHRDSLCAGSLGLVFLPWWRWLITPVYP